MGDSNNEWGALEGDDQQAAWDGYASIPEAGESAVLDSFLSGKRLTHGSLVRVGARLSAPTVLAFGFPGGIKFRNIITGDRWNWAGATFNQIKIVPGADRQSIILCEGETDAARLTTLYPCDVGIAPLGARTWKGSFTPQVSKYRRILCAYDNDESGEEGFRHIAAACPNAMRFAPPLPAGDWCEFDGDPPELPPAPAEPLALVVFAGELAALEAPKQVSWFQDALLPVAGSMLIHGWTKSYKSFVALDILAALAQGDTWAEFESEEEPTKVAVVNWEVSYPYYRERVLRLREAAPYKDLFDANFGTFSPLVRPRLVAGNTEAQDDFLDLMEEHGVQVILFDPIRRAIGRADPNSEQDARLYLSFMEEANRRGLTTISIAHDNKAAARAGGGDITGSGGSGAFVGDVDTIVSVSKPNDYPDTARQLWFTLRNAPAPGPRRLDMGDGLLTYTTDCEVVKPGDVSLDAAPVKEV